MTLPPILKTTAAYLLFRCRSRFLLEENESFRSDLLALIANYPKSASIQQIATATGDNNKIGQASGQDIKIHIS